jgi:hypothetical protein
MSNVVRVEWLDIVQRTVKDGESIRPAKCETYGELENQDDVSLTIIQERSDDDITKQVFPLGCIVYITPLTEVHNAIYK